MEKEIEGLRPEVLKTLVGISEVQLKPEGKKYLSAVHAGEKEIERLKSLEPKMMTPDQAKREFDEHYQGVFEECRKRTRPLPIRAAALRRIAGSQEPRNFNEVLAETIGDSLSSPDFDHDLLVYEREVRFGPRKVFEEPWEELFPL